MTQRSTQTRSTPPPHSTAPPPKQQQQQQHKNNKQMLGRAIAGLLSDCHCGDWSLRLKFDWKRMDQQFWRYSRNDNIFGYMSSYCDLDLEYSNTIFCMSLWFLMMHIHIKFGYKSLNRQDNIVRTSIQWSSEPLLWPWPLTQQGNTHAYHDVPPNYVWLQKNHWAVQKI